MRCLKSAKLNLYAERGYTYISLRMSRKHLVLVLFFVVFSMRNRDLGTYVSILNKK